MGKQIMWGGYGACGAFVTASEFVHEPLGTSTPASFLKGGNPHSSSTSRVASPIASSANGLPWTSLRCLHFLKNSSALFLGQVAVVAVIE